MGPERTHIGTRAHCAVSASFAACDRIIRGDFYAFCTGFTVPTPSGHTHRLTSLLFGTWNAASCDVLRLFKSAPL